MSFAINAARFDEDFNNENLNNSDDYLNKKKQTHNKTQKKYPKENFDTEKVNSVLEQIHNNQKTEDTENNMNLGDFNPPPKPQSAGVNKTISTEQMMNMTNQNDLMFRTLGRAPQPNYQGGDDLDLNNYTNYGDGKTAEEYYKKMLPSYNVVPNRNPVNKLYHSMAQNNDASSQDVLLQKINYMISLLEDSHDEKTNNVTEEVILYSFLGIFIIFIADSFARVGKYVR
jgi:hypothetical protein